jgi:hypothetical protein
MADDEKSASEETLRLKRPSRVKRDERGHNVWVGEIEDGDFELMSTRMVEALIRDGDEHIVGEMSRIAGNGVGGVLTRDCRSGRLGVLDHGRLESLLTAPGSPLERRTRPPAEAPHDLELMDTGNLRRILAKERSAAAVREENAGGGSNPYDNASRGPRYWK